MSRGVRWIPLGLAVLAAACLRAESDVAVRVVPADAAVPRGATFAFRADVSGTYGDAVVWSVDATCGQDDCGSVDAAGVFRAPLTVPPEDVVVRAESRVTARSSMARVRVVPFEVEPSLGPTSGGTLVTIRAAGFEADARVFFDDIEATEVDVESDGLLRALTPARTSTGPVAVRIESGGATLVWPEMFRYAATALRAGHSQLVRSCSSLAPPVAADLTGDGVSDVVLACNTLRQIAVHPGRGAGIVDSLLYVPADLVSPTELFTGDPDGDGDLDVIVANDSQVVEVEARGTLPPDSRSFVFPVFSPAPTPSASPSSSNTPLPRVAAVAPVCASGNDGVVLLQPQGNAVSLHCRNATVWQSANSLFTQGAPSDAAAADFDGDGAIDLAIAVPALDSGSSGYQTFRNSGGAFPSATPVSIGPDPIVAIAAGDLTGDSDPDLVLGSVDPPGLWLATGSGGIFFTDVVAIPHGLSSGGYRAGSLEIVDVDGDGSRDLLARHVTGFGSYALQVFFGTGSGLGPPVAIAQLQGIGGPLSRALDLDGIAPREIVARNTQSLGTTIGYLEVRAGSAARVWGPEALGAATRPAWATRDPTGVLHLGLRASAGSAESASIARVVGSGSNGTVAIATLPSSADVARFRFCDCDANGGTDLLIADDGAADASGGVWLASGDGAGGFASPALLVPGRPIDAAASDLDDDGFVDVVAPTGGELLVWWGTSGAASFTAPDVLLPVNTSRIELADFGADGGMEVVAVETVSATAVVIGFSGREPQTLSVSALGGVAPTDLAIADFDGDTIPDVAVRTRFAGQLVNIDVFAGTPQGLEPSPRARVRLDETNGGPAVGMDAADVDGDLLPDLAFSLGTPNALAVLRGRPDGTFDDAAELFPFGFTFGVAALYDADGVPPADLLACELGGLSSGDCRVYRNDSR